MKPSRLLRALARSHRWLGLGAAVFMLWVAITGVLVNRAGDFGFARATVRSAWLLDAYNIGAPPLDHSFRAGPRLVAQAERSLYLGERHVARLGAGERLVGAVAAGGLTFVASDSRLRIVDGEGKLVEAIDASHGLPTGLRRIGLAPAGWLAVEARDGLHSADPHELVWRRAAVPVRWSTSEAPPPAMQAVIEQDARTRILSREQLVRDLHSGRLFGRWAKWLADLFALALIVLSLSGIWLWWRARREFPRRGGTSNGKPRA